MTDLGANTPGGRRTHMCVCPRITEAFVIISLAGGALIGVPLALAAAAVVAPPALIVFIAMPKEKRARAKANVSAFIDRL